ncbi:MAG: dienelactone hydrolase family protein [Lentisphaeraceae bacterium]|nr:dienelactone hydrolase family protein [Lentisphaeraceae bacterium]
MNIVSQTVSIPTPTGNMDTAILSPKDPGKYPALILYSEIFQLTGPIMRSAAIIAGHGFIVAVPEVYHEHLDAGTVLGYDDAGKTIGNDLKNKTRIESYDEGVEAIISYMSTQENCSQKFGSVGFCLGGHLAFRAALNPKIEACASFYGTDIHSGTLGTEQPCNTFARINEIQGELMMLWGRQDPHIPTEGRQKIYNELCKQERNFTWHEFNAVHAFMRDEGERYNPALANTCYNMVVDMFTRVLKN